MEQKRFLVTFEDTTYPIETENKLKAREEFSRQYLGYVDTTFCGLLKVKKDDNDQS